MLETMPNTIKTILPESGLRFPTMQPKTNLLRLAISCNSDEADPELMFQIGKARRLLQLASAMCRTWFGTLKRWMIATRRQWLHGWRHSTALEDAMDYALMDFVGVYDSEQDFGEEFAELQGEKMRPAGKVLDIDYESYGDADLLTGYSYGEHEGRLWVWQ